jgi:hypothetical protein
MLMAIDGTTFLVVAATLAAGGVGGWVVHERTANSPDDRAPATPPVLPSATPAEAPVSVEVVEAATGAAVCDDSVGTAEACPSVGPSDEGICANTILKRCNEFKMAFKPRVAQQAVACLRQLKANERCDPARINQCGHAALMAACPESAPPSKGTFVPATGTRPASVTLAAESVTDSSPLTKTCENLVKSCGPPLSPTLNDCRQTLAGMTELGRASLVECVTAHCTTRGLLGCEAFPKAAVASQ